MSYIEVFKDRVYDLLDVCNRSSSVENRESVPLAADEGGNRTLGRVVTCDVGNEGEVRYTARRASCFSTRELIYSSAM